MICSVIFSSDINILFGSICIASLNMSSSKETFLNISYFLVYMARGRPTFSEVRQNMVDILQIMRRAYGYELAKVYLEIFPKVTKRLFYYHLRKGVELEEFAIDSVEKEKGEYSWGSVAEKTYYTLGSKAEPRSSQRIMDYFDKKSPSKQG